MKKIAIIISALVMISACSNIAELPSSFTHTDEIVEIYPDYDSIIIPANIAPLNFNIVSNPKEALVLVKGEKNGQIIVRADNDHSVIFDPESWNNLLENNRGADLYYTVYTNDGKSWVEHPTYSNHVAEEDIDPYLSYRLIEPGYSVYSHLGIYQRDLTSFQQIPIYRTEENYCINCHCYKNYRTNHMMFHVRENNSGTIVVSDDKVEKINTKADSMFAACVYPSWHPTQNKIAFSTNQTGQNFFIVNPEKVEVVDNKSYLVLYDLDNHEISTIIDEPNCMETFPSWNPTGDCLYYSTCRNLRNNEQYVSGNKSKAIDTSYDSLYYDIWSIPYDTISGSFGIPQPVFEASKEHKSATLPRVSNDGKWLLFTLAAHGQFHIWHRSSDIYIKNLQTDEVRKLSNANSSDVDSYHSWSSNGRWIVLSSRREDLSYTRPYICYFDKYGNDYKPFVLPQEDPLHNKLFLKSYNVPEFTIEPVKVTEEELRNVVTNTEPVTSAYIK